MSGAGAAQENDRNEGGINIAGGEMRHVVMGHQHIESQTVMSHTYNPVGASDIAVEPGTFGINSHILVHELNPISASSRVFNADLQSGVTGTKPIVVKLTPHGPKFLREAKIHFSVPHHKNIVERIATDVFNFRGVPTIFIAMERCDCNLHDHIKSEVRNDVAFDSEKYTWISYQILVALDFLHSHNVVHGDLKPSNVLLILNGNVVKLCDFGLSRAITEGHASTQLSSPQGGTSGWLAPEILEGATQISKPSDIFPCGLVFHFTWSYGKHAYGDNPVSRNHFIMVGENRDLSRMLIEFVGEATTLLERMFQRNPADRPTAAEILQNPIFGHFDTVPLTADQFQTVLRLYLHRNRLQLTRIPSDSDSDDDEHEREILAQPSESMRLGSEVGSEDEGSSEEDLETTAPKQHFQYFTPSHLVPSTSHQHSLMPVSTAQVAEHPPQLPEGFTSAPLCRRGCDILLLSDNESDADLLPQLPSKIFGSVPHDGKLEFMHCDGGVMSGFESLTERLLDIPVCANGITTVVVARFLATGTLDKATNSLRVLDIDDGTKRNLAVFTLKPYENISQDSAKVTLNISLNTHSPGLYGILRTGTLETRKRVNKIAFHGKGSGIGVGDSTCLLLEDFIENPGIVGIIQKFLRREEGSVEYCAEH